MSRAALTAAVVALALLAAPAQAQPAGGPAPAPAAAAPAPEPAPSFVAPPPSQPAPLPALTAAPPTPGAPDKPAHVPLAKRWWFWAGLAGAAVGVVVAGIALSPREAYVGNAGIVTVF